MKRKEIERQEKGTKEKVNRQEVNQLSNSSLHLLITILWESEKVESDQKPKDSLREEISSEERSSTLSGILANN